MKYRIRYRSGKVGTERETMVEAHSPAEAVVKFRSVCVAEMPSSGTSVTSVAAEDSGFGLERRPVS